MQTSLSPVHPTCHQVPVVAVPRRRSKAAEERIAPTTMRVRRRSRFLKPGTPLSMAPRKQQEQRGLTPSMRKEPSFVQRFVGKVINFRSTTGKDTSRSKKSMDATSRDPSSSSASLEDSSLFPNISSITLQGFETTTPSTRDDLLKLPFEHNEEHPQRIHHPLQQSASSMAVLRHSCNSEFDCQPSQPIRRDSSHHPTTTGAYTHRDDLDHPEDSKPKAPGRKSSLYTFATTLTTH